MIPDLIHWLRISALALAVVKFALRSVDAYAAVRGDLSARAARGLAICGLMLAIGGTQTNFLVRPLLADPAHWRIVMNLVTLNIALALLIVAWWVEALERWHRHGIAAAPLRFVIRVREMLRGE